ncbi:Na(+)/H(+) antiporter subunit F1 [Lentibacillus sp. JNUCC-1]|uniref:Na(+)/H(+) antiporter subunit F1 n=1 Tax=Lentibacillus sp. JNUCC-1 TaxID=2654513 RepID=UPI0012E89130|nr:Na(+)/H(+) antiporter subunit F1 [Lentibacillus sp. JNUCC-1]MUV39556.1 Na(+)/H(+) antiporter subunit F1 [Lentibacillus sp. JNUCC-1]
MNDLLSLSARFLDIAVLLSIIGISLSLVLLLYRIIKGPTNPDRAVALDAIGINLMGVAALVSIVLISSKLNDVVLLIGILSFLGTLAVAKYLEAGVIIDRDRN